MPTQRLRLTKTEEQEYRSRLSWLEKMSIAIGPAGDPSPEPARLRFEQTWDELSRIYQLPSGAFAVVLAAMMMVLKSGILTTRVAIMTPWDDRPLDLWDPEGSSDYQGVFGSLYHSPPRLLNPYLKRELPLDVRRVEGVIIAHGDIAVPPEYPEQKPVKVKLLVRDERRDELSFGFVAELDRSMMHKWKRRQRERLAFAPSTNGGGLFAPKRGQPAVECFAGGSIKQPYASGEHDVTYDARNPETRLGDR